MLNVFTKQKSFEDGRLKLENRRYYLSVPYDKTTTFTENQGRVVAIDPGVRSFITFYSLNDQLGQIGVNDFGRIVRLAFYLDDLIGRASKAKSKVKIRMLKAAERMRWRIKDLVSELHNKASNFLVENFDLILLPEFPTAKMARKTTRKIRAKSVRSMLTFSHYKFRQRLLHKAQEMGKDVVIVDESYTSKTNSWTGELNRSLGGAKTIQVGSHRVDRDINGARNILIKWLSENTRALSDHSVLEFNSGAHCEQ